MRGMHMYIMCVLLCMPSLTLLVCELVAYCQCVRHTQHHTLLVCVAADSRHLLLS